MQATPDTRLSRQNANFEIHPLTVHQAACGQGPSGPDHPWRSRGVREDLGNRPAVREVAPGAVVDGAADDLCEQAPVPGG